MQPGRQSFSIRNVVQFDDGGSEMRCAQRATRQQSGLESRVRIVRPLGTIAPRVIRITMRFSRCA
jgi:hypothetical protein